MLAGADLAQAYSLRVFPDAVGLRPDGRENLLTYGTMVFNAFGPRNRLRTESMAAAEPVRAWIADRCKRAALAPGGLGTEIYAAVDRDEITEDEAGLLVRSLLSAGSTPRCTLSPGRCTRWRPARMSGRRCATILRWPGRLSRRRCGTPPRCRRSSAPRPALSTWPARSSRPARRCCCSSAPPTAIPGPGRIPIASTSGAAPAGHVGLGSGIHACVGAALARLEGELLLTAMARQLTSLELAGPVRPYLNNTIKGLAGLPRRLRAA